MIKRTFTPVTISKVNAMNVQELMHSVRELGVNVTATVTQGSRVGTVGKALTSRQCNLGSIPGLGIIGASSLLLVLVIPRRAFL